MVASNILKAIQQMKLDIPSSDYVEVKMEHLEELYSYIRQIERVSDGRSKAIIKLNEKISLMNCVTKDIIIKPKLDTYM